MTASPCARGRQGALSRCAEVLRICRPAELTRRGVEVAGRRREEAIA